MVYTNKALVYPNPTRENTIRSLPEVLDTLLAEGFEVYMEESYSYMLAKEYPIVSFYPLNTAIKMCDFILVVGGDGTILHITMPAAEYQKPILGINFGTMGFLSELELKDIDLLKRLKLGEFSVDKRMLLNVTVKNSKEDVTFSAVGLNDAAIMKRNGSKIIKVSVAIDQKRVIGFAGDGVLVCTPTGSTAYSLSAGGPILEPSCDCMAVTPVCPHSLVIKSFVVPGDREIEISFPRQDNDVQLSVDGYNIHELKQNERVFVRKHVQDLELIRLKGIGFYERINQKLSNERL